MEASHSTIPVIGPRRFEADDATSSTTAMRVYAKLPVVDFASFRTGSTEDRKRTASEVDDALKTAGFFHLQNHGIPQQNIEDLFEKVSMHLRIYFQHDTKLRFQRAKNSSFFQMMRRRS